MIKTFRIFESSLYSSLTKADVSDDESIYDYKLGEYIYPDTMKVIRDTLKIDDKVDYLVLFPTYCDFSLHFHEKDFVYMVDDVEDGVFGHALSILNPYSNYEEYVDKDELEYLSHYMSDENEKDMIRLGKLLDVDINFDGNHNGNVGDLLLALGNNIDYNDFLWAISSQRENAVKQNVKEAFEKLPFDISDSFKHYDLEIEVSLDKLGEYLEKNKDENINTFEELLESIDFDEFGYYELTNSYESNYEFDYKELQDLIENALENVIIELEDGMEEDTYMDPNQLSLFDDEESKNAIKRNPKKYNFQYNFFSKIDVDKIGYAIRLGGKLAAWFESYEFQKNYMNDDSFGKDKVKKYKFLKNENILHPIIIDEYEHFVFAKKFNL